MDNEPRKGTLAECIGAALITILFVIAMFAAFSLRVV